MEISLIKAVLMTFSIPLCAEKKSHKILNPETREAIHCHKAETFVTKGIFPKGYKKVTFCKLDSGLSHILL